MRVQTAERLRGVLSSMAPTCVVISATEVSRKVTHWQIGITDIPFSKHRKRGPTIFCVDRDSSVGIATRYGLGGPDIESQGWRDFLHPPKPAMGSTHLLQWVPGLFQGRKPAGAWC